MIAAARYAFDSIKYADVVRRTPLPLLSSLALCLLLSLIPLPPRCCITSRIARRPNATRVGMSPPHSRTRGLSTVLLQRASRARDVDNCQKSYSSTGCQRDSDEIRDPVGEDIYYFADSARRSAPARGKRRKNFPSGTRRHKAIRRSNKRVNNRAVVAVRAAHSASLFLPALSPSIYLYFILFLPVSLATLFPSIHLSRSIAPFVLLLILDTLSLSRFRCSNRTSIKRSLFFNHKCIKCRDQFSPHDRALFVCRRRFNLLSSARFDSARLSPSFPSSLPSIPLFLFLFLVLAIFFSPLFPFFGSRRDYIVLRITGFADEATSAFLIADGRKNIFRHSQVCRRGGTFVLPRILFRHDYHGV